MTQLGPDGPQVTASRDALWIARSALECAGSTALWPDRFGVRRHVCALVSRGTRAPRYYFTSLTAPSDFTPRSAPIQSGVMPPHSRPWCRLMAAIIRQGYDSLNAL